MTDTVTAARVNRLTGRNGRGGGGLPLPDLWGAILQPLLDAKPEPLPDEVLLESVRSHEFLNRKTARIQEIYDDPDPWILLFDDAISQLHQRKLIETAEPRGWKLGTAFKPGKSVTVIPAARGHAAHTATVRSTADHEAGKPAAEEAHGINELTGKLSTHRGFRKINDDHLAKLVRSMEAIGWRPELGLILRDQHGRILDGFHRFESLNQLGLYDEEHAERFVQRVIVDDDREALGIVWAANLSNSWSKEDADYFTEAFGGDPFLVLNSHERARVALKVNANQTDSVVADKIGVGRSTVTKERRKLAEEGVDVRTPKQRKRASTNATAQALKALHPEMSLRGIAQETGVDHHTVAAMLAKAGEFGSATNQTPQPAPTVEPPVFTSETPVPGPSPEPKPAPRRKGAARLQHRLEATMVSDADYLFERMSEIIPDPNVMATVGARLHEEGRRRGGIVI